MIGSQQSPVDVAGFIEGGASDLEFDYSGSADHITNTGEFVKVMYEDGGGILIGGIEYRLIEAHAHNPGEHAINGELFALEMHLLHTGPSGEIAVVGILYRLGRYNAMIQAIIESAPGQGESRTTSSSSLLATDFLPANTGHYAYMGSLTTPPYTEAVRWLVLSEIAEVSQEQVRTLAALTGGGPNNRAIQPLNGRQITAYGTQGEPRAHN